MAESKHNIETSRRSLRNDGRLALVVGGYGAIGRAITEALAMSGAVTIIGGRNVEKGRVLASLIAERGGSARAIELDVEQTSRIDSNIAALTSTAGPIDILINCVGLNREEPLLQVTEGAFDEVYRANLKSAMFLGQAVARRQVDGGRGGKHVHLLSVRSSFGFRDRGYSAFCAAKGGLAMLIKQHATELSQFNITVNGVAPGAVRTEKNEQLLSDPLVYQRLTANIPLRRMATPTDVSSAVLFLSSAESDFVTGQTLFVDGGLTSCQ